jgi:hypothetical protein
MGSTKVDVLSLENFQVTLQARLDEARAMVTTLSVQLAGRTPRLGTFQDGSQLATTYRTLRSQQLERARRLVTALEAAQTATSAIVAAYHTTEQRNQANVTDIAARLGGVAEALKEVS